jgi:hypothetical protein
MCEELNDEEAVLILRKFCKALELGLFVDPISTTSNGITVPIDLSKLDEILVEKDDSTLPMNNISKEEEPIFKTSGNLVGFEDAIEIDDD